MRATRAIFFVFLILAMAMPAYAQGEAPALRLTLRRNWGYGGLGGNIQGTFSYEISGPENLVRVAFYLDDAVIGEDEETPFRLQFSTGQFEPGVHKMYAVGYTAEGEMLRSNEVRRTFLSGTDAMDSALRLVIPLLVVIGGLSLLGALGPMLFGRGSKKGAVGEYGMAGGAVCRRCGLPYARPFLAPNLGIGKLARCPHCGKWSVATRARREALAEAEARLRGEMEMGTAQIEESEEDRLRQQIEASRFEE